jgi:hypothetical protein
MLNTFGFDQVVYLNCHQPALTNEPAQAFESANRGCYHAHQCISLRKLGPYAIHEAVQCADNRYHG